MLIAGVDMTRLVSMPPPERVHTDRLFFLAFFVVCRGGRFEGAAAPGAGGLAVVAGSHKSNFECPKDIKMLKRPSPMMDVRVFRDPVYSTAIMTIGLRSDQNAPNDMFR